MRTAIPFRQSRSAAAISDDDVAHLIAALRTVVGRRHVLTGGATRRFADGYRVGGGAVTAVARPANLRQMWAVLQICVANGAAMIVQAANTGLTGGSTPAGDHAGPIVIVNTLRIATIVPLHDGRQVLCLAGATLHRLERLLRPFEREPHSVIGSSCLGASVIGGICNNSGGALVRRGPAYTELSLYAHIEKDGQLRLVNALGIDLGDTPDEMLARLDAANGDALRDRLQPTSAAASDPDYARHVRDIDAASPARFNADPRRLHGAAGCAGKVAVLAVRLDTFPVEHGRRSFLVATNDPADLSHLRRTILRDFDDLPVSGEYMHRDALDLAGRYGRDSIAVIDGLGTERLPQFFAAKSWLDRRLPRGSTDRAFQVLSGFLHSPLPPRMRGLHRGYSHFLIVTMSATGSEQLTRLLGDLPMDRSAWLECTRVEARRIAAVRYAVAGAAIRFAAVHATDVGDVVALDLALRRNDADWFERLPPAIEAQIKVKLYYGHFFCHVFHQDYVLHKGANAGVVEAAILALAQSRGAKFPAEHNVGHKYPAEPALLDHYRALDPLERFNPGIGEARLKFSSAQ